MSTSKQYDWEGKQTVILGWNAKGPAGPGAQGQTDCGAEAPAPHPCAPSPVPLAATLPGGHKTISNSTCWGRGAHAPELGPPGLLQILLSLRQQLQRAAFWNPPLLPPATTCSFSPSPFLLAASFYFGNSLLLTENQNRLLSLAGGCKNQHSGGCGDTCRPSPRQAPSEAAGGLVTGRDRVPPRRDCPLTLRPGKR